MPTTTNRAFQVPVTGTEVGTWADNAVNPNFQKLDTLLGGVQPVALSATNVTLIASEYANMRIQFTGTLLASVTVVFPNIQAFWVVENLATGNFVVGLQSGSGAGQHICAPPGARVMVLTDGSNSIRFLDAAAEIASYRDFPTFPAWWAFCTVPPYLFCDGAAVSRTTYAALFGVIGTTYGAGDGSTTFNVPDCRGRVQVCYDAGANRVTSAGSGINGNLAGASGGFQTITLDATMIPSHTHTANVTDPGHNHTWGTPGNQPERVSGTGTTGVSVIFTNSATTSTSFTGITVANTATGGDGPHNNMPPSIISYRCIKT